MSMYPYEDTLVHSALNPYGDFLMHYGVLGQKWGVRRYQNADGTLTEAGKAKYRTGRSFGNGVRASNNGNLGQRFGVITNKGYRKDVKEIKAKRKELRKAANSEYEDPKDRRSAKKQIQSDYKKTKLEARLNAANALYRNNTENVNKKVQTENLGKAFLKNFLFGGYGALNYNRYRDDGQARISSAIGAYNENIHNYYSGRSREIDDYFNPSYRKRRKVN